ncbi:MAG: aldehyde dehydrogenase family protein [Candidatus Binatia bacterium]
MKRYGIFVAGEFRDAGRRETIRDPADGRSIHEVAVAGEREVEEATAAAARAFSETRRLPRAARAEMLSRAAAAIQDRFEDLAETVRQEAGKPITLARFEVTRCLSTFTLAAEEARRFGGENVAADVLPRYARYRSLYERMPIGPVLGITPFNFPVNLVAHKVAPALAAGNSVVVKPAPQTPVSALKLAEILHGAGATPGSVNVVPCSNELAAKMVADERFRMLSFTGGTKVGWQLRSQAGKKKVTLELGGNAGLIVAEDCDLEVAAEKAAHGGFAYAGQTCISVQRIYAQRTVFERFLGLLVRKAEALPVGGTSDERTVVGPMVSEAAADRVMSWLEEARAGGARALSGGRRRGNLITPAVLVDVKPTMKISCAEVFGPIVTVEPYEDFGEAVTRINDSPYGLQAGVFTHDQRKIDHAFRELEVGAVLINETSNFRIDNYPYGGVKESGTGREGVRYAMESMTEPRVLVLAPA